MERKKLKAPASVDLYQGKRWRMTVGFDGVGCCSDGLLIGFCGSVVVVVGVDGKMKRGGGCIYFAHPASSKVGLNSFIADEERQVFALFLSMSSTNYELHRVENISISAKLQEKSNCFR